MDAAKSSNPSGKYHDVAEKKEIIKSAELIGVTATAEKYATSAASIYNWIKVCQEKGDAGLEDGRQNNTGNSNQLPEWKRKQVETHGRASLRH
jgi:transposase-like protein